MRRHGASFFQPSFDGARRAMGGVVLGMIAASTACSSADPASPTPVAPTSSTSPNDSDAGPAPRRQLIQDDGIGTAPTNLLVDPFFANLNTTWLGFIETSDVQRSVDGRSPTGFGGGIAVLPSEGELLSAFLGGPGPFEAEVWVSKTDNRGNPLSDVPIGDSGIRVTVASGLPDPPDKAYSYDLVPSGASLVASNGRTWISLRARIEGAVDHMGFFVVQTSPGTGKYLVASPSVVAEPLAKTVPTRARPLAPVVPRALRDDERSAIRRYMDRQRRLDVPAFRRAPLPKAPR